MEKITEYGTIKISDNVFEKMIRDAIKLTEGRDELSSARKNIAIYEGEDCLVIEFHVVHMFGTSLRFSTKTVLDHMEKIIRSLGLARPVKIIMKIVAVRARRLQKRDLEFTREIK